MRSAAVERFHAAQSQLLADTYDAAWHHGVATYEPDPDPPTPDDKHLAALAGAAAGATLAARRLRRYREPSTPDPVRRAHALEPASAGLSKMTDELHQLTPTRTHHEAAEAAAREGQIDAGGMSSYAEALAASDWAAENGWRLDAGESVAWAGEQSGYAEAADADGQLLEWLPESDDHVCEDCESLGELPPMPLAELPTTPGSGDTICNAGCRCVLQVADDQTLPPLGELDRGR